ncbi:MULTISPECIES: capsule biosynthesis GfcC family protein [unclassified Halomonas]|uniref:capsule biosynthesis GfcC family protein n=1 Tax=unclassified Halomonas TaxID=2609666 RepID=UPI0021E4266D|nr:MULTISPECIES: capsule biosynthesis GfcC family protein [unclassified Halomonas]UYF99280.1 capsule biosynthesis GfcC family protein [Halomonas sp. GD1P12]WNL39564.1 capsule biosynthesis GfcC family protein [Halomonas sp. PAMB 3232]
MIDRATTRAHFVYAKRLVIRTLLMGALVSGMAGVSHATEAGERTLADAWLETLSQQATPISWSHAYALLLPDQQRYPQQRRYLIEELGTLVISAQVTGNTIYAQALLKWQEALRSLENGAMRSPQRLDLLALGTNLREAPLLENVAYWGVCDTPDWVEVWGLQGVSRTAWRPNMTIDDVKKALPEQTFNNIDHASLITPQGNVLRRGVAAWNHETTPLAPGSRLLIALPSRQGLMGALPFPGTTEEPDIINQRLPGVLAAQLPGDQCTQWHAP